MQYLNINSTVNPIIQCETSNKDNPEHPAIADLDRVTKTIRQKPKILVVEDEPINQTVVRLFLKEQGYGFDIASSGEAALTLFSNQVYAAILMDIGLPGIDGLETTRCIRALEKSCDKRIPIIACTANGLEYKPKCLEAGMDDFSVKPFEFGVLSLTLKDWLKPKIIK